MGTQELDELYMVFLQACYLGREPATNADCERAENGNFLALIQAFLECTSRGLYPEPWILNGLQFAFHKYLEHNKGATGVKDYMTLDKVCGLSRNVFRAVETENRRKRLAEQFYLFKWAFGLENKEIDTALRKCGYEINVSGKEAENPERVYERSEYAQGYETFVKVAEKRGYTREATSENLLKTISPEAKTYIERRIEYHKK